jgi:hypothetical protein
VSPAGPAPGGIRTMPGTTTPGNPLGWKPYVYRGTGVDVLEVRAPRAPRLDRERCPAFPGRILAALESLGGEASTPEIRAVLDLDGGPSYAPNYLIQTLGRLARRNPPAVSAGGRERSGKGRAGRWQLGPGAAGNPAPVAPARPARRLAAAPGATGDERCRKCTYLTSAPGHKLLCGDAA